MEIKDLRTVGQRNSGEEVKFLFVCACADQTLIEILTVNVNII